MNPIRDPLIVIFESKKKRFPLSQRMWWDRMMGWSRAFEEYLRETGHKVVHLGEHTLIRWDLLVF